MRNLSDLFEHQLKDLYSAEKQLLNAMPKVVEYVTDSELKNAIESHRQESENQKDRISDICAQLDIKPTGEECKAMKGLIEETEHFLDEEAEPEVKDAGIVANCQRIEHYEIAGYGTAVRYAKELGYSEIADKLQKTLDEEYVADETLDRLAESKLNEKAQA